MLAQRARTPTLTSRHRIFPAAAGWAETAPSRHRPQGPRARPRAPPPAARARQVPLATASSAPGGPPWPLASGLHPTPHRAGARGATAVPAQQPGRGGKRDKDRQGTPQGLQLPARPLMRCTPSSSSRGRPAGWHIPGDTGRPGVATGAAKQAHDLTRGKALTPQQGPTAWGKPARVEADRLARPTRLRPGGSPRYEPTATLPGSGRERPGVFHRAQQTWHSGSSSRMLSVRHSSGKVSFCNLGKGFQKRTAFSLLCQPPPTEICAQHRDDLQLMATRCVPSPQCRHRYSI